MIANTLSRGMFYTSYSLPLLSIDSEYRPASIRTYLHLSGIFARACIASREPRMGLAWTGWLTELALHVIYSICGDTFAYITTVSTL